jgi:general secretion pathway protein A
MYLSFYELVKKPFQISADPLFLWMGEKHKEALAILKYGIMDNRGFVMLTGDVGTGKTTLINALANSLGSNVIAANITDPGLEQLEFINHIASMFNLGETFRTKGDFLLAFRSFLERCYRDGKQVLLIIDEAQRLSQKMLEEIRLLSNIERQDTKLLNIFFVGQDELNDILDRHENRALRQRMTLHYHLEPLSEEEIDAFIRHRLKVAGAEKRLFSKAAVTEIYAFSKGFPRLVNIICDHALLSGYVAHKRTIDAPEIRECAKDLKLPRIADKSESAPSPAPELNRSSERKPFPPTRSGIRIFFLFSVILLVLALSFFLYFPIKAGASISEIMEYWMYQARLSNFTESRQVNKMPVAPKTFRVSPRSAGTLGGEEAQKLGAESVERGAERLEKQEEQKMGEAEDAGTAALERPNIQTSQHPSILSSQHPGIPASRPLGEIPDSEKQYRLVFNFDSNDMSPEAYQRLDTTAALMKSHPGIDLIITGHTDAVGTKAYNSMLSKFRSDIAKNYLVSRGVAPERIESIGKGAEEPIASNDDVIGRRANRRVEVEMVVE